MASNGQSFLAQELTRHGSGFRKDANAFRTVDDRAALEAAGSPRWRPPARRVGGRRRAPDAAADRAALRPLGAPPGPVLQHRGAGGPARGLPLQRRPDRTGHRHHRHALRAAAGAVPCSAAPRRSGSCEAAPTAPRTSSGGASPTAPAASSRPCSTGATQASRSCAPPTSARYQRSFVKQDEKGDRLLRTETCLNHTDDLGVGRHLEHLPELQPRLLAVKTRSLAAQADRLASTVDAGDRATLAQPLHIGGRRVPALKRSSSKPTASSACWRGCATLAPSSPTGPPATCTRLLARHRLTEAHYRLSQRRSDLGKLRAHGLVERCGTSRRSCLTARGLQRGVLLVTRRTRLLGPLTTRAIDTLPRRCRSTRPPSEVEAAFRQVDVALNQLCDTLGLKQAA